MTRVTNTLLAVTCVSFILLLVTNTSFATHSVSSSPASGTYNTAQSVVLTSSEPAATIFYTIDGSEPTNSSSQFDGNPIEISTNTTLKFLAVDPADNHTSAVVTEIYAIDTSSPTPSASPSGGTYDSAQTVTLNSDEPSAIYYTTDGSEPTNSSSIFTDPLNIATDTTIKILAIDIAGNTSPVVVANYVITPAVLMTEPGSSATSIDPRSTMINVTFSKPMDESTINADTFQVTTNNGENSVLGIVLYNATTNTATFRSGITEPVPLDAGTEYTVSLTTDIHDVLGNPLSDNYAWNFTTWFTMAIVVHDLFDIGSQLPGSEFTIAPSPLTLEGTLVVQDNGEFDEDPADGRIEIGNVEFGTYILSETGVPENFAKIYDNMIFTVHETNPTGTKFAAHRDLSISISELPPIGLPGPHLTDEQFQIFDGTATVGKFEGIYGGEATDPAPVQTVADLDSSLPSILVNPVVLAGVDLGTRSSLVFTLKAPAASGSAIFNNFDIPVYLAAEQDIASELVYLAPAIVIPYEESKDNFVLTPIIAKVFPGQNLFMIQPSFVESKAAKFESVNMTFAEQGTDIGFAFGITDTRPPGTTDPGLDAPALFLDISFVGDIDFSDPGAFESPPRIDILVNKTLPGFDELPDGCTDFVVLLFDEDDEEWVTVQQLRNPTLDSGDDTPDDPSDDRCGFTLEPPHFSKFAVGGVKGQTISTESDTDRNRNGGGGGGSRSTAVTPTAAGDDIETSVNTRSGEVLVRFASVEDGSGQLKINSNELSSFEEFFDEVAFLSQDNDDHGMVRINGVNYATTGDVFDIDASAVKYDGTVDVTIPYDEGTVTAFGAENEVRFLHYNTELGIWEDKTSSVDEVANTVTGALDSLSPVTAAISLSDNGQIIDHPGQDDLMSRLKLSKPTFSISAGGEITLSSHIQNMHTDAQGYVMIVQVVDVSGVVQQLEWQPGSLAAGQDTIVSLSMGEMGSGTYTVQVLLLTDLQNPWFLSQAKEQLLV